MAFEIPEKGAGKLVKKDIVMHTERLPGGGSITYSDDAGVMFAFVGDDDDDGARDVSKPLAYDQHGNALVAPRGPIFHID